MATSLEELLVSIDIKKVNARTLIRTNKAINSFIEPVKINSWESFEYYLLIFVAYLDEHVPLFEPVYIFVGHPWDLCVRLFNAVYGNNGEEVAFNTARTGNNGGLGAVMRAVALRLVDAYTENEIITRVNCYWQGLSLTERVQAPREYISKYGHLLPSKFTVENANQLLSDFPSVLRQHPWAVRKYVAKTDKEQTIGEHTNEKSWVDKLELLLAKACEAEARKNFAEAEHQFRLALFCDGRMRPDVPDAKEYVRQAGPVYKLTPAAVRSDI